MKRLFSFFLSLILAVGMNAAKLNIFASGVEVEECGTQVKVHYDLNAPATAVTLQLLDATGTAVASYPITDSVYLTFGSHLAWVTTTAESQEGQTWAVKAAADTTKDYAEVTNNSDDAYKHYLPQGVAVNNVPTSSYFGQVYVTMPWAGESDGGSARTKTQKAGLYVYDALLNLENEEAYQLGLTFAASNRTQFKRVKVGDDGSVYVNRLDAATCIYKINPADLSKVESTITDSNFTTIAAFVPDGDAMWVLDFGESNAVYKVEGGVATKKVESTTFVSTDVDMVTDGRGGVWIAQHRWGLDAYAVLTHVTADGTMDYVVDKNADTTITNLFERANNISYRGTLAMNSDKTILAFGGNKKVTLFSVSYDTTTGVPTLAKLWATANIGSNIDGIAFDAADNLYFNSASAERFYVYATPKDDNSFVTPACKYTRIEKAAPQLNIFASQVAVAGTGTEVEVHYVLNAPATEVALVACSTTDSIVSTNIITDATHMTKGKHQFTMTVAQVLGEGQHWAIKATADIVTEYTEMTNDSTDAYKHYLPQGVAVNNVPTSPYFGKVYVTMPWAGESDGGSARTKTQKAGLYVYDALLNLENEEAYQLGLTFAASNRTQFKRVKVGDDGSVYVNRLDAATCIYKINPADLSKVESTITDSKFTKITAFVPDDDAMWVLDYGESNAVYKVEGGVATKKVESTTFVSTDVDMVTDGRGGVWIAQHRWGLDAYAVLTHVTADGTMDYVVDKNADTTITNLFERANNISYRGTLAMNSDKTILAFGGNKKVTLFSVSYDTTTGVPTLAKLWATANIGSNIDGIAFDAADNLYFNSASAERFYVYTTPKLVNSFISPATSNEMPGTVHVDSIVVTPDESTPIEVGDAFTFSAAIFPANATNKNYTWSIADATIATINAQGVVTAVAKGTTKVYAVSEDNNDAIDSAVVNVIDKIWYYPNIYASALTLTPANEENQFHISYVLNAPATAVKLIVTDSIGTETEFALSGLQVGENGEDINLDTLAGGKYFWAIEASAELKSEEDAILCNVGNSPTFVAPRGVVVDNNSESPFFGRVYVTETNATSDSAGFYIFDATSYTDGIMHRGAWNTAKASPMRITIGQDDGLLYISDWGDVAPNIHVVDPATPDQETLVFGGTVGTNGVYTNAAGDSIHGSMSSCYVRGTGESRVLYTFDEDLNTGLNPMGLFQYNIGTLSAPWEAKPSAVVYDNAAKYEQNGNSVIIPDAFGGWWISQDRATDGKAIPALIHVGKDSVDFNSGGLLGGRTRGAIAFNKDQTMLVTAADNALVVWVVTWNENNIPTIKKDYTISTMYGAQNSTSVYSLAIDPAYNIYATVDKKPLQVWAGIVEENICAIDGVGVIEISKPEPEPEPQGLMDVQQDNVDVRKVVENGHLIIIRNGEKFNAIGAQL